MKLVDYEDAEGRKFKVSLPDDAPDTEAALGNPLGPPLLDSLNLPHTMQVQLHNFLFDMGIFTAHDANQRRQDIVSAIQRICAIHVEAVIALYGQMEKPQVVATISIPTAPAAPVTNRRRR